MFDLFKYYIYLMEGQNGYDPLSDMMVSATGKGSYLTWRHVDQDFPAGDGRLYAGAVWDDKAEQWIVVRLSKKLDFWPGIDGWLEYQRIGQNGLGRWQGSKYHRFLRFWAVSDVPQDVWSKHQLELAREFFDEHLNQHGERGAFMDVGPSSSYNDQWQYVIRWMTRALIEMRGVVA